MTDRAEAYGSSSREDRDKADRERSSRDDRHRSSRHEDDRHRSSRDDRERDHRGGDRDRDREREHRSSRDDRERHTSSREYSSREYSSRGGRDDYRSSRSDRPRDDFRAGGGGGGMGGGGGGGGGGGDWRSGGGGGGRDDFGGGGGFGRGGGPGRGRGPDRGGGTPERRSPTPPTAVPLTQRKRTASGWDVHAPGYEQYSAEQAKQTGLFNLPGQNRMMASAPIAPIPGLPPGMAMGLGPSPNLARQSRRLYIGSITPEITEDNLTKFFNQKMREMNLGQTGGVGDPVLAVQVNYEKNYAFVEFRSADDATAAMAFDGIIFQSGPLRIRRPKDYMGNEYSAPSAFHVPGVVSTNVPDSLNKIFVGGLPTYLNEEQVMELLKSFGELKAFNLVREANTGPSKGFAFFEYVDSETTDVAIQGLSGMELGDRTLVVQRASVGAKQGGGLIPNPEVPYDQMPEAMRPIQSIQSADTSSIAEARILLMLNMVTVDDLVNDDDYADLTDDIKEECGKFGSVEALRVPRPARRSGPKYGPAAAESAKVDEARGVGRVYVKFFRPNDAQTALRSLAGRSFGGRSIICSLLSENSLTTPPLHVIFSDEDEGPAPPTDAAPPPPTGY